MLEYFSSIIKIGPAINLLSFSPKRKHIDYKGQLDLLRNFICFNQGELAQYSFLAGEKHKAIKDQLRVSDEAEFNLSLLKDYCDDLTNFLNWRLKHVSAENFNFLNQYFKGRSRKYPVGICIKVISGDEIIEIFRDYPHDFPLHRHKLEENTGIQTAFNTGKFYLCNNIPEEVKNNNYQNPRLDYEKAVRYKNRRLRKLLFLSKKPDNKWVECWKEVQETSGRKHYQQSERCYKSTLIIPMTLQGNDLSPEFRTLFNIQEDNDATYGFLCIANHSMNYFKERDDVNIGYLFADILSLYFVERLTYTNHSETFSNAKRLIGEVDFQATNNSREEF